MNRIIPLLLFGVINVTISNAQDETARVYSLEEYRAMALGQSKTILISKEKLKMAEELKKAAFTQFFPNFSANATYMWNQKSISLLSEDALLPIGTRAADGSFSFRADQVNNKWTMVEGQAVPLDSEGKPFNPKKNPEKIQWKDYAYLPKSAMEYDIHNVFAGGLGFTQPIFMGNKIRELYNISKSTEQIVALDDKQTERDLIIEVDESYWRTVSLLNKQKLARKLTDLLEKLNSDVENMLKEGVATKGDLLNVRVKLNEAHLALTRAENGVRLSSMALYQLCGLNINGNYGLADEDISQQPLSYQIDFDINKILDSRLELKKLEQLNKIESSKVKIMKGRFMPTIALSANYLLSNPNSYNGYENKFGGMFNAGVVVSIPIFHFGDKIHTLRSARYSQRIVNYQIQEAKEKIELQVTQSNFRFQEANKKLTSAQSNIASAEENLKLAEIAYKEGLISITDLLGAQTAWVSANSDRIDASIDVRLCELYLMRAKGEAFK
jgi:outer membrane protein